jgi:tape measure domain-containing protein
MARMSLDTAIRLSAEVKGGANITKVQRSLQDLAKGSQTTAREMSTLRAATFQFARANDSTIAGIRSSIGAFRGLQEQAKIGSREFQRYGAEIQKLEGKLRGLDTTATAAGDSLGRRLAAGLASSLATIGAGRAIGGSLGAVVASEESERRLRSLSQGLDDYSRVQAAATAAAEKFGTAQTQANQEFAQIYARLRPIGLTLEEISTVYNGFNTAAKLSGTTSAEASAAFLQLSQALGTGVLRGEELNSVFEQTPAVVQSIAQVMGVPIGQIRELAKEGKITGDIVLTALGRIERDGAPKLAEAMKGPAQQFRNLQIAGQELQIQFGQSLLPTTIALTKAATGILEQTSKLPEPVRQVGAAAAVAGVAVLGLTTAMSAIGGISAATKAMQAYAASTGVATKSQVGLNLAVLANPWVLAAAGIIAATAAAYKFNEPFREFVNTIPARFEVFFQALQRDVQAAAARAQAVIASVRNFAVNAFRAVESVGRQAMQNLLNTLNPVDAAFRQLGINIQSIFGGVFESIGINWGRLISQMLGQLNPMQGILKLLGVDMAGAMEQALNFRPSAAPQAAALPATAPIPGTLPGAPSAPALPGGGGAAGGGGGGGGGGSAGSAPKFELSSRGKALVAAAQKLGVSPLDLATIISFETAGTFSPSIRGGTGNNYMGLIQFGAPERQKYGASPNQSFEEQVMGPVVRYFQDRFKGVGMSTQGASLLDLYTTVLAGNPKANRNARDSFGTSAVSGVSNMGPHRQKALSTFFGGSMENVGFGAVEQAQATTAGYEEAQQTAEQFLQRQQAATTELEKFIEARTQAVVKLNQESELLGATTDLDRRRLEYAFEQLEINDRAIQVKREFQELEKQLVELGIDYNAEQQLARIESEKQHALKNAQVKAEQDINDLMAERVRMMQQLTSQAAEPAAFQTQGMAIEAQIATLKDDLAEMTSIATLAGKSAETIGGAFGNAFRDLISGAASARQVLSGFFEDVAQGFAQMAAEIIAKQMAMIALQTILKALGAVAGGGSTFAPSGPLESVGSFSPSLSFDPSNLAPRALGGSTASGQPYKVGENGPELFVPYQAGSIIPAEATEALEAINNASLRGLSVPFQATAATAAKASQQGGSSSSSSGLSVPFQRGMEGLSVPFQRGGMDGSAAAGGGAAGGDGLIRFETVQIGELDFVTRDEAQRIGRESAKQGAALAQKRITNNPTARRQAGLS